MRRLEELFGDRVKRIYLLGGEPLLNKYAYKFFSICRTCFRYAEIKIITNGLLIKNQMMNFWEECKKNNIIISITKYPIDIDYTSLKRVIIEHGCRVVFFGNESDDKRFSYYPLDENGRQDITHSFLYCNMANNCVTLKDGVLYPCVVPPNIVNLNRGVNTSFEVSNEDGINIYKANSAEEIQSFLAKPIPFCRYCMVDKRTYDNKWDYSKLSKDEGVNNE